MATQVGITAFQARELLRRAEATKSVARVRTFQKNRAQHAGRAVLLEVLNDTTARIMPHGGHKKTETVPLATLRLWQGGNVFDTKEIKSMQAIEEPTSHSKTQVNEFVVYSQKMGGVWGGNERKWTSQFNHASIYRQSSDANRAAYRLKSNSQSDDAEVLSKTDLYLKYATTQIPSSPVEQVPVLQVAETKPNVLSELLGIDLDSILNNDGSELQKAFEGRKKAANDVREAQVLLEEAVKRLKDEQARIDALIVGLSTQKKVEERPARKAVIGRGALKGAVRQILTVHSRLDNDSIVAKVQQVLPDRERQSILQTLYSLKMDKEAERDDNGGWALTKVGREKAKKEQD